MAEWADEITLISETEQAERVNDNGFPVEPAESSRTVF